MNNKINFSIRNKHKKQSNRIMLKFLTELYKICEELPNIDNLKQNSDIKAAAMLIIEKSTHDIYLLNTIL